MKSKKIIAIILMLMSLNMVSGCQSKTPTKTTEQKATISGKYSLDFDMKNYTYDNGSNQAFWRVEKALPCILK